jgi:hypothetical protein
MLAHAREEIMRRRIISAFTIAETLFVVAAPALWLERSAVVDSVLAWSHP